MTLDRRDHALARGAAEKQAGGRDDPRYIVEMGEAAEWACASALDIPAGGPPLDTYHQIDSKGRDPGWDMVFHGWKLDVKWSGELRRCLLVFSDVKLAADIYPLVVGRDRARLWMAGWAWRDDVVQCPVEKLAKRTSFCYPTSRLQPMSALMALAGGGVYRSAMACYTCGLPPIGTYNDGSPRYNPATCSHQPVTA
jgi:hypothetical protein